MASRTRVRGYIWVKISIAFGLVLGLLLLAQTVVTYRYVLRGMVRQEAQNEADRRVLSLARASRLTGSRDASTLGPVIDELIKEAPQKIAWMRVLSTDGKVIASGGSLGSVPQWTTETLRSASGGRGVQPNIRTIEAGDVLIAVSPLRFGGGPGRNGGGPQLDLPRANPPAETGGRSGGEGGDRGPAGTPPGDFGPPLPAGASGATAAANFPPNGDFARGPRGGSGDFGRGPGRGPGGPYVETAIYLDGVSVSFAPLLMPLGVGTTAAIALLVAVVIIAVRFPHYLNSKQYEEELALARRVQNDLFPREGVSTGNVEFAARFIPSRQVGGDLYDIFETDDGGVAMVLGDVSGKGLSAALLMGVVQGAIRTSSDAGLADRHEHAAERLNHLLCMKTARERFVSLFWCYLNQEGNVLSYINAGHLPALLVRERFGRPDVWRLEQGGGPVLGVLPGARYRPAEIAIEPGDLLVVFSDGVSEAANAAGEEFGEEGIIESVKREWRNSAGGVCDGVLADVRRFLGDELPHDDQTLMVVRLERVVNMDARPPASQAALPARN